MFNFTSAWRAPSETRNVTSLSHDIKSIWWAIHTSTLYDRVRFEKCSLILIDVGTDFFPMKYQFYSLKSLTNFLLIFRSKCPVKHHEPFLLIQSEIWAQAPTSANIWVAFRGRSKRSSNFFNSRGMCFRFESIIRTRRRVISFHGHLFRPETAGQMRIRFEKRCELSWDDWHFIFSAFQNLVTFHYLRQDINVADERKMGIFMSKKDYSRKAKNKRESRIRIYYACQPHNSIQQWPDTSQLRSTVRQATLVSLKFAVMSDWQLSHHSVSNNCFDSLWLAFSGLNRKSFSGQRNC